MDNDQPTVDDRPLPTAVTRPSGTTTVTPLETLRAEEAERARTIIRLGRVAGLAAIVPVVLIPTHPVIRYTFAGAVVVAVAVGFWLERVFRDSDRYSDRMMMFVVVPVTVAFYAGMAFWGIFSSASILMALAIYFFSRRESWTFAAWIVAVAAGIHAGLATLVLSGAMPDPGVLAHPDQPRHILIIALAVILVGYLGAFLLGRASHRATLTSIENMQRAMLFASQREALLHEAHGDLDRVRQLGGAGRYTDQTFGSYKLGAVIGRGGMGEVYEASHVETGELAAAKLLHPQSLEDPRHVTRFLREVQAVSALKSPHVVRVLEACDPADLVPFFIMERLHGHDLSHHLRNTRLSASELDDLIRQVGSVVDAGRQRGIVHRDLKPSNLFLAEQPEREPVWKVLDFGVATLAEYTGTLTQGNVVGTPAYMAPEQAQGTRVDHRADVYALAAIGYRWLTGRPAFSGADIPALLYQVVHEMPLQPSKLAGLDADVDAALAVGLAKRAEDRFDTALELGDALKRARKSDLDIAVRRRAAALLDERPWRT